MAKDYVQKITIDASMQVEGVKKGIADIEKSFASMKFNPAATKGVFESIEKLKNNLAKFEEVSSHSIKNAADSKAFEKSWDNVSKSIDEVNSKLIKLKVDPSKLIDTKVLGKFDELKKKLVEIQQARDTTTTKKDTLSQQVKETGEKVTELQNKINSLKDNKIDVDDEELNKLKQASEEANIELEELRQTKRNLGKDATPEEIGKLNTAIKAADAAAKKAGKSYAEYITAMDSDGQMKQLEQELKTQTDLQNKYQAELNQTEEELKKLKNIDLSQIKAELTKITGADYKTANVKQLIAEIDRLATEENGKLTPALEEAKVALDQFINGMKEGQGAGDAMVNEEIRARQETENFSKQMNGLQTQMMNFFSLTNGWNLLRRSIRAAIDVVKELDEAMTGMAVVSEYSLGDIWEKRGEFSQSASELGVTTLDLVNATTLYVQQGLALDEAMGVAIETMKMGRIANLEGEEATNLMTAALRGYNMEMTQAAHVNDVYSNLAAKTASDTEELATAMSKTASIAYNSGASFENMSAFLAQIIETTREAPETAGTAMKTIIARFQELKKPLEEIGEVEGEVVDANKIEGALRLAGVALRDAKGEFRDFDDVILELSGKWNSLDKMTQRYIATMAAGSRQQSRFLALMNDNKRLLELTGYAADSAGASQQQFDKTLESFQSKLAKFQNALDVFYTNLANNTIVKGFLDVMTGLVNAINILIQPFADANNVIANFAGALIEVGIIAIAFKVALTILGAAAKKTAASMALFDVALDATKKAEAKTVVATSMLEMATESLKKSYSLMTIRFKAFILGLKGTEIQALETATAENVAAAAASRFGIALRSIAPYLAGFAIALGVALYAWKQWNKDAENAKKAAEALEKVKEETEKSNEELAKTRDLFNGYTEGKEKLKELDSSTEEYKDTLVETNDKARELIETLGLFDSFSYDENGLITIDEEKLNAALETQRQNNLNKNIEEYQAEINSINASQRSAQTDFIREYGKVISYNPNKKEGYETIDASSVLKNNLPTILEKLISTGFNEADLELIVQSPEAFNDLFNTLTDGLDLSSSELTNLERVLKNCLPELGELASSSKYSAEQLQYFGDQIVRNELSKRYNEKALDIVEKTTGERDQGEATQYIQILDQMVQTALSERNLKYGDEGYDEELEHQLLRANLLLTNIEKFESKSALEPFGNLKEVLKNSMATGEFDAEQLILNKQQLEMLQQLDDRELMAQIGEEGLALLREAGVSIKDIHADIQAIDYEAIIGNVLALAGGHNKTASNAITDIQKGNLTAENYASGEYKSAADLQSMISYVESLLDMYPELEDEVKILNKTWLIGTEEYSQALSVVQDSLAKMDQENLRKNVQEAQKNLNQFFKDHPVDAYFEVNKKELRDLQNELDKAEFELKVAVKTEGRQNISELEENLNNLTSAFDVIDDNLQVAASDFMDLVDVFPELAEGIEVLDNGMIQLSEDSVKAAQEAGQGQVDAMADAKIAELEIQQAAAQANVNYYQALLDAANKAAEAEVDTEEEKTQAINNLEHLLAQAVVNYANETNEGVTEQAENTATNIGEASAAAGNTAMTNGQRMATNVIDNLDAIAEEGDLSAGAVAEAQGEAAGVTNTAWYQAASNAVAYLNKLAQAVNKVAKKSFTYDEKEGLVEHPSSLTPLPTDSSVDYKSVDEAYTNRHQKEKASVSGPDMLSGEVNLSTTSAAEIAKQLINSEAFRNQFKADAASRLADAKATLADINAQIATIEGLRNQANKKLADKTKNTGSGGSGGGGGGGSGSDKEEKKWVQDYDWLYNLLQEINKLERNINKLQKERNRLINNNKNDSKALLKMAEEEELLLKKQLKDQQVLQVKRLEELAAIEDQYSNYKDENNKSYDFTKYATYDPNLGYTIIDYDAIAALDWTEDVGKAFEGYVTYLENIQKDLEGIEDSIDDLEDSITENQNLGRDEYIQWEKETITALKENREEEIEKLEELYKVIDEGNRATIDAINDGISEYRDQRDKDKQLKDINDQERRLALMMTDTSGANQLDILNAQKTLDDARQSYTDSLIDKAIENMEKQADEASKQRERQIDLANAQLENDIKNGTLALEAEHMLFEAFFTGQPNKLIKLFEKIENVDEMGYEEQKKWHENFLNDFEQANVFANRNGKLGDIRKDQKEEEDAKKREEAARATEESRRQQATRENAEEQRKVSQARKANALADAQDDLKADLGNKSKNYQKTDTGSGKELRKKVASQTASAYPKLSKPSGVTIEQEDAYRGVAEFISDKQDASGWGSTNDIPNLVKKLKEKLGDAGALRVLQIMESIYNHATSYLSTHYLSDMEWMTARYSYSAFETGGLADFTGPAWLDGTKSKPEYILNADQTERFFDLLDFTKNITNNDNSTLIGDTYYNISMSNEISSDYDVDSMWDEMQRKIYENAGYRNVQSLDFGRR